MGKNHLKSYMQVLNRTVLILFIIASVIKYRNHAA